MRTLPLILILLQGATTFAQGRKMNQLPRQHRELYLEVEKAPMHKRMATPASNLRVPLTEHYAAWDTATDRWRADSAARAYRYQAAGQVTQLREYDFQELDSSRREQRFYDDAGRDTAFYEYTWGDTAWSPDGRLARRYDARGNEALYISYDGNSLGGWDVMFRVEYTYTYDALGRLLEQVREVKGASGASLAKTRHISTYPAGPGGYTLREYFVSESGNWKPVDKYANCTWHNFERGEFLSAEYHLWIGGSYELGNVYTWTYPNATDFTRLTQGPLGPNLVNLYFMRHEVRGDTTQELDQSWNGVTWKNETRWTDVVNARGQIVWHADEKFEAGQWMMERLKENAYEYDAQDNLVQLVQDMRNGSRRVLGIRSRWRFSDFVTLAASRPMIAAQELRVRPNPAVGELRLAPQAGRVTAIDAAGKVYSIVIKGTKADVSSLKPGLYQIRAVGQDGKMQAGRFVKE